MLLYTPLIVPKIYISHPVAYTFIALQNSPPYAWYHYIILEFTFIFSFTHILIRSFLSTATPFSPHPRLNSSNSLKNYFSLPLSRFCHTQTLYIFSTLLRLTTFFIFFFHFTASSHDHKLHPQHVPLPLPGRTGVVATSDGKTSTLSLFLSSPLSLYFFLSL